MLGVLGVYAASLLSLLSVALLYLHVASARSFAVAEKEEAASFHLSLTVTNMILVLSLLYILGTFVSYGNLVSIPLSLAMFAIAIRNADVEPKPFPKDPLADAICTSECIYRNMLAINTKDERVRKFKTMLAEGSKRSLFLRYALASPPVALVASSFYPFVGPVALFAMGYSLEGKVALMTAVGGWFGLMASLRGEMGPLVRARLIEEKLKIFIKNITFPEALVAYLVLVIGLSAFATYGFYKKIKDWGIEVVALFVPLVAYAIAQNRFGEPLAVASFALGATLAAKGKAFDPLHILSKLAKYLKKLGGIVLYYEVPMKPYYVFAALVYHAIDVLCDGPIEALKKCYYALRLVLV